MPMARRVMRMARRIMRLVRRSCMVRRGIRMVRRPGMVCRRRRRGCRRCFGMIRRRGHFSRRCRARCYDERRTEQYRQQDNSQSYHRIIDFLLVCSGLPSVHLYSSAFVFLDNKKRSNIKKAKTKTSNIPGCMSLNLDGKNISPSNCVSIPHLIVVTFPVYI